jgi:preprotein translocase subunit SecE
MADSVAMANQGGNKPSLGRRTVDFYNGVLSELKRVTWPDRPQVQSATIAIIIFVLLLGLVITALDFVLQLVLIQGLPSLFAR